jgi:hypothetical protein
VLAKPRPLLHRPASVDIIVAAVQAVEAADDAALDACLSAPVGHAAIRGAAATVPAPVAEAVLAAAYARFRCSGASHADITAS